MTDSDRLDRLRLARDRIVARLDDPRTPAYSVAPLSNQLRLVEQAIARLIARDDEDDGLPSPERFSLVVALGYWRWLRGPVPARRRPSNDWTDRQTEIFESWKVDDVGMRAVPAVEARRLFAERAAREARLEEDRRRRAAEAERKAAPVPAGVPAKEGMNAFETMMAAPGYQTVREEYGLPAPNFMDEQFAEGQKRLAEAKERREYAEKKRAVDRMLDDVRGKE